jgi:hypothetical protein
VDGRDKPGHDGERDTRISNYVMAGFMPAIHVLLSQYEISDPALTLAVRSEPKLTCRSGR